MLSSLGEPARLYLRVSIVPRGAQLGTPDQLTESLSDYLVKAQELAAVWPSALKLK